MNCQLAQLETTCAGHRHSENAAPAQHRRVLIVDDDPLLLGLYTGILELEGYEVESAEDGLDALVALSTRPFDLVLTDFAMPRLDGAGLVRELRLAGNHLPVVMVSGSLAHHPLPPEIAREVAAALPKPAMPADILHAVAHTLRDASPVRVTAPHPL
jgi:two-component system response regulator MprA